MRSMAIEVSGSVWAPPPLSPPPDGALPRASSSSGTGALPAATVPSLPLRVFGTTRSCPPVPPMAAPLVPNGVPVASDAARTVLDALQDHEVGLERRLALAKAAKLQAARVRETLPPASRTRGQKRQR